MKVRVKKKTPVRIRIDKSKPVKISPGVEVVNLTDVPADVTDEADDWDVDVPDDEIWVDLKEEKPVPLVKANPEPESGDNNSLQLPSVKSRMDMYRYLRTRSFLAEWGTQIVVMFTVVAIFFGAGIKYRTDYMDKQYQQQVETLAQVRDKQRLEAEEADRLAREEEARKAEEEAARQKALEEQLVYRDDGVVDLLKSHVQTMDDATISAKMQDLYDMNADTVGWLSIDDTVIDYVVMQTPNDEDYYLDRDFQRNYSAYGSLIMDTDSQIGSGTKANEYADGSIPCTNLIVHGHNMKNGTMFGGLDKYRQQSYEKEHSIIKFSSLYEDREYEICAVFLSQVYLKTQTDVFKYYKFFQADTEEEFNDFYDNIKKMSMYDTGVAAEFGDEFITLSVCAYHVENGRLVVVGKRIK